MSSAVFFRANAHRTGVLDAAELPKPKGAKWRFQAGGNVFSTPVVAGGLVCFGSRDRKVYALDTGTGEVRWSFATGGGISASPAVMDGVVTIGSEDGNLYALGLRSGHECWRVAAGYPVVSSAVLDSGVLYVGTGLARPGVPGGGVLAVDVKTGREGWRRELPAAAGASSPAVEAGRLFCGCRDHSLYALDTGTGAVCWSFPTGHEVIGTPAVSGGTVFFTSCDACVYAADAATGRERWRVKTGLSLLDASPAVAGGLVFIGGKDGHLRALDAGTGQQRWSMHRRDSGGGEEACWGSPVVAGATVLCGCSDGRLYALDAATGCERWSFRVDVGVWGTPVVTEGMFFLAGGNPCVFALQ